MCLNVATESSIQGKQLLNPTVVCKVEQLSNKTTFSYFIPSCADIVFIITRGRENCALDSLRCKHYKG